MRSFSCFKPRDPFRNWSKELDKRVAIWARDFDSSFKLLLLGPAGAGKTTIMKQMKIIHFEGFSLEERQQKAKEIRANLLESVRELTACITASGHQINWCDKENQNRLDFINGLGNLDDQTYDIYAVKIYDYSKRILTDKGVEELFAQLNQLSITHRSQYLLNRVDEIRNVNYIPNNDDILQSRRRTSDIQKLEFQVKLPVKSGGPTIQQTFCMFDVGGQRGERRKWIQVFDGVSAVMFLIDSSSFDAVDDENGRNKLKETINLFYEVWTTRFLLNSNFVLLFNKQDILRQKIERGLKIEDHFPEFRHYKFQPAAESGHRSHRSDKLNLFRSTSNRSTRSTGSSSSPSTAAAAAAARIKLASPTPPTPAPTPTTKRKSASMYLFGGGRSSSSSASSSSGGKSSSPQSSNKVLKSPAYMGTLPRGTTPPTTTTITTSISTPSVPRASDFHEASTLDTATTTTGHHNHFNDNLQAQDQNQTSNTNILTPPLTQDQAAANHLAYLKARSFIRDKFLQVTRQVHHLDHLDRRKFSSPNLPLYNNSSNTSPVTGGGGGGTGPKGSAPARIDCPKRNVCYHYTTATDTENIRDLFENLQKMVFKSAQLNNKDVL